MEDVKKIISEYLDIFSSPESLESIIRKNKAAGLIYPHTEFYINFGKAMDAALQEIEELKANPTKAVKTALNEWKDLLDRSYRTLQQRSEDVRNKIDEVLKDIANMNERGEDATHLYEEKIILESPIWQVIESFRRDVAKVLASCFVPIKGIMIVPPAIAKKSQKDIMQFCEAISQYFNNKAAEVKAFFVGENMQRQLDWNHEQRSLGYLIRELLRRELLIGTDENRPWKRCEECFTVQGEPVKSRSIGTNNDDPDAQIKEGIDKALSLIARKPNKEKQA